MSYDRTELEVDGNRFAYRTEHDADTGAPWDEHDGHGPVSGWKHHAFGQGTKPPKRAGELILLWDCGSYRTYDFAEACRIARRDGWGVAPYRMETEHGKNGLCRINAQWFEGRELVAISTDWHDDINDAIREAYAKHRATFPSARAYAARAARADFERLSAWCNDKWHWCGVIVELLDDSGDGTGDTEALWGIESDCDEYHAEVARELASEIIARLETAAA